MLSRKLTDRVTLEPASEEDLEAELTDFEQGAVATRASVNGKLLVVQAKRRELVATVVGGPASKGHAGVRAKAAKRLEALAHRAAKRDIVFNCDGPRWLGPLDTFGEEIAATYVFGFSPRRASVIDRRSRDEVTAQGLKPALD